MVRGCVRQCKVRRCGVAGRRSPGPSRWRTPDPVALPDSASEISLQPRDGPARPPRERLKDDEFLPDQIAAIHRVLPVVLTFHERSARNVEQTSEVAMRP